MLTNVFRALVYFLSGLCVKSIEITEGITKMNTKQIRHFLTCDYPRLALLATGRCLSESSVKPIKVNISEKGSFAYYQNVYALVSTTIAELENTAVHPYRTLIVERFVKRKRMIDVREMIGYCKCTSNQRANQALKKFAETFRQEQIKNKVYPLLEFE